MIMNRESLYDISWKVSEGEYRLDPAYSYSTLSRFNREGFDKLDKLYDKLDTPSLLFGSVVDTLLTGGQKEFDDNYITAVFPNISDTMIAICNKAFLLYNSKYTTFNDIPDDIISKIGKECDFWAGDKWDKVRARKIKENDCNSYYDILYLSMGKKLISINLYQEAVACVDVLRSSESTKWYFEKDNPFNNDIERFYQLKFKGSYEGINIRCMMDLVIVDHKNKKIIPCDLKTSSKPEWKFYDSYVQWRYMIQSQLYWEILHQNLCNHPIYKDYEIDNYRFIVISKFTKTPLVWLDENTKSDEGYSYNGEYIHNWRNILFQLNYYLTEKPKVPYMIQENELNIIQKFIDFE